MNPRAEASTGRPGDALRNALTAIARDQGHDVTRLRSAVLPLFKEGLAQARAITKRDARERGSGAWDGADAFGRHGYADPGALRLRGQARVLRAEPDRVGALCVVATGGYGRGVLAPGSDIDLLFVRPYKQTPWDESVIEFILYMLWDLGLKVGHATRSIAECVRLAKQNITIRTVAAGSALSLGRRATVRRAEGAVLERHRHRQRPRFRRGQARERDERHLAAGESRYLVEPNVKDGKGGLRDLQTLYWIGKYLYRVEDASDLVSTASSPRRNTRRSEGRGLPVDRALPSALSHGARGGAAVVRRAARAGEADRASPIRTCTARSSASCALLPRRQGCRRSDAHFLRRAGGAAQEAVAVLGRLIPDFGSSASTTTISSSRTRVNVAGRRSCRRSDQSHAPVPCRR